MVKRILLAGRTGAGLVALVDDADLPLVARYTWWAHVAAGGRIYARGWVDGRHQRMHNVITGRRGIDHVNGNRLDNRRVNLRDATPSQQGANRDGVRGSTSAFKGVELHACGRWKAEIRVNRRRRYLGLFAVEEDAARAYDAAAVEAWGEFARLNFPAH